MLASLERHIQGKILSKFISEQNYHKTYPVVRLLKGYCYCQRAQASEDARLARRQHYRAVRIVEKISSACKVTFLL